jgi:hypothetical protein
MSGRRGGASPNVQRSLGWIDGDKKGSPEVFAPCTECGGRLRFDVMDPLMLGRSMQACTNAQCDNHRPHPMTRADFTELSG